MAPANTASDMIGRWDGAWQLVWRWASVAGRVREGTATLGGGAAEGGAAEGAAPAPHVVDQVLDVLGLLGDVLGEAPSADEWLGL